MYLYEVETEVNLEESDEVKIPIEEVIENFRGYANPFWYEKKDTKGPDYWKKLEDDAQATLLVERKRPNSMNTGTKPDIEIRW